MVQRLFNFLIPYLRTWSNVTNHHQDESVFSMPGTMTVGDGSMQLDSCVKRKSVTLRRKKLKSRDHEGVLSVENDSWNSDMGVNPKIGVLYPKMDGENNGEPYEQMDDLGFFTPIFGNTHMLCNNCFFKKKVQEVSDTYILLQCSWLWLLPCVWTGDSDGRNGSACSVWATLLSNMFQCIPRSWTGTLPVFGTCTRDWWVSVAFLPMPLVLHADC